MVLFFMKKVMSMLMKKCLLLVLFVVSTNAVHGMGNWLENYWASRQAARIEAYRKEKAQAKIAALEKKRADAEESFYQNLKPATAWWPDLSDIERYRHDECIQAIERKYGISGDIFRASDLVKEAYTQMLIYFLRHHVAGDDQVTIVTDNYKTISLNLDKQSLKNLVRYAHEYFWQRHGFLYEFIFDQVASDYEQFIEHIIIKKKSSSFKKVPKDLIPETFHSLLCFWFLKIVALQLDSPDLENCAGSFCC